MQVKVCGFTDEKNISSVASLPIDAAGFVLFRKSSRYVPSDRLDSLIRMLPERVTPVLLFVNPDPDEVSAVTRRHPEVLLQFHGEETPEFCRAFGLPYMKAVHFEKPGDLLRAEARYPDAAAILADCPAPDSGAVPGGNGTAFDWELARSEAASLTLPLVLAGGLNAENAAAAYSLPSPRGAGCQFRCQGFPGNQVQTENPRFFRSASLSACSAGVSGRERSPLRLLCR
ncbi:MAG: phosphoribosylanthranilate isomerase [Dakarella massiliensis]